MTEVKQLISQIASEHLLIPTLESRKSDDFDFHTVSVWAVEAALNAAFEAGGEAAETDTIDIEGVLAKRNQIAIIWNIEDVQEVRPHLTEEQAWQVLQASKCQHDANLGINWHTLESHADFLFGDAPEASEA